MDITKYLKFNLKDDKKYLIKDILNLKYEDSESIFLDKKNTQFLLTEIVNIINNYYDENTMNELNSFYNYEEFIFNNISMEKYGKILNAEKANILIPQKGVEGAINCTCGSTEGIITIKQNRSSDEPATVIKTCVKCGTRN